MANDPVVVSVLRRALALIERHGWIQGNMGGPSRGFCLLGAVCTSALEEETDQLTSIELRCSALALLSRATGYQNIVWWNDDPARSKQEVIDLLARAIAADDSSAGTTVPQETV